MFRRLVLLGLASVAFAGVGCSWCKSMFGCDRRCDSGPPPGYYSGPPPVPVQYAPPPPSCAK